MSDQTEIHEDDEDDGFERRDGTWERVVYMIVLMMLFWVAVNLFWFVALGQAIWTVVYRRPNDQIAEFGARLGVWLKRVALYVSGATDEKPFPWREID